MTKETINEPYENTVKLKPCPFCGGKPYHKVSDDKWHRIDCCQNTIIVSGFCGEKVEDKWNTRPTEQALQDELEKARKYIEHLGDISDTCTKDYTGKVCSVCKCGKQSAE